MSEHIENYSHLVQQVERRHGIDRKDAADGIVEATSISWIRKRKTQERSAPQKAFSVPMGFPCLS